jgi:hypothetical protein
MKFERRGNRFFDCTTLLDVTDSLTNYFRIREAQQRGGRSKSEAKRRASRLNGTKHVGKKAAQSSEAKAS